ncbi:MAG TPA: hypothetical protein VK348_04530 [Planctomycetota bacterium]|nr:hypothetical protein [Planctomycetota bacterium]
MQISSILGCVAFVGALCLFLPTGTSAPPAGNAGDPLAQQPAEPTGHLVLVVQGDAHALRVTNVVAKTDPFAGVPKGLTSDWQLVIADAAGAELGRYPIDMAHFDLEPANVGRGRVVTGDVVRDSRVTLLLSVPDFAAAASMTFVHGQQQVGAVSALELRQLRLDGGK